MLDVASGSTTSPWKLEGKHSNWHHGQLPLPGATTDFAKDYAIYIIGSAPPIPLLCLLGYLGGAVKADIALDDVQFKIDTCDSE